MENCASGFRFSLGLPGEKPVHSLPRPVWIHVGRISVDRNIERFLKLDLPGSKVLVGDGPDRERLQAHYPDCHFLGYLFGDRLTEQLNAADVFVYPGRTDHFGLLMLEDCACGLPVAALPPALPLAAIHDGVRGVLDNDLEQACVRALRLDRSHRRNYADNSRWRHATEHVLASLARRADRSASALPANP